MSDSCLQGLVVVLVLVCSAAGPPTPQATGLASLPCNLSDAVVSLELSCIWLLLCLYLVFRVLLQAQQPQK